MNPQFVWLNWGWCCSDEASLLQFTDASIPDDVLPGVDDPVEVVGAICRNPTLADLERPTTPDESLRDLSGVRIGGLVGTVRVSQDEGWAGAEDVDPGAACETGEGMKGRRGRR